MTIDASATVGASTATAWPVPDGRDSDAMFFYDYTSPHV